MVAHKLIHFGKGFTMGCVSIAAETCGVTAAKKICDYCGVTNIAAKAVMYTGCTLLAMGMAAPAMRMVDETFDQIEEAICKPCGSTPASFAVVDENGIHCSVDADGNIRYDKE